MNPSAAPSERAAPPGGVVRWSRRRSPWHVPRAMRERDPLFTFRLTPVLLSLSGLPPEEHPALLARHGLPPSAAMGTCTVALSAVRGLIQEVATRRRDPCFGLTLATSIPEGTYGLVELLARTAPSVGDALRVLARHGDQINPVGRFEATDVERGLELHYHVLGSSSGLGALQNEFSIAFVVRAMRLVATAPLRPTWAWFAHDAPSDRARLEAFFECPLEFGAKSCGFALDAAGASLTLTSSDAVVHEYLAQQAAERGGDAASFTRTVCLVVEQQLGFDDLELNRVAEHLAMTPRTLQRRLTDEGTSFSNVVDGLRRQHAERLLREGVPAERAAELLGFASAESFRRALRRWRRADSN